jgi:phosphoribosylglycinamide formyltransferase 1
VPADAPAVPRPEAARSRVVVLLSGAGTLFAALLSAAAEPGYPAEIVAVGADRADAAGLGHARERGLETFVTALRDHPDRAAWDRALAAELTARRPDWVVCAGFMKILGPAVLDAFAGRVVNTHPALLPAFPGAHAVRDALAAGVPTTGATVHLVDAGVDTGPVLAQRPVPVLPDDDEARLHERIKTVERELLVQTLAGLLAAPPTSPPATPPGPVPATAPPTQESIR